MTRSTLLLAFLAPLAAGLTAAFVVVPPAVAAIGHSGGYVGEREFTDGVRAAVAGYWRSGERAYPAGLREVVDYWFRYHVAKAAIAGLLLVVFVALAVVLWKSTVTGGKRAVPAIGGVVATLLALFSLAVVMANVQGAAAPFASLLPMVADADDVPGRGTAAFDVMVDDFAWYHAVMAVIAAVVAVALIGTGVLLWRRRSATDHRPARRVLGSFVALSAVVSVAVIVVAVANATTAADPEPALLALFAGSW